jgi:NarL family two-component system response regulator YdfI
VNQAVALTAREIEILRELARVGRNGAIAEKLGIAERTVKAHLESIYMKLGVESRAAAVAAAIQRKLI